MRKDTWLKVASGIWILSAVGGAIALAKGVRIMGIVETVGYLWILLAMAFGKRFAIHFPKYRSEIAFGLAIIATALGIGSILYYSTTHIALTLWAVAIFCNMASALLAGRDNDLLMTKSIPDIYRYFRAGAQIQREPIERVLDDGSGVDAGIHCLSIHHYDLVGFSAGRADRLIWSGVG
jgi:hypothetical protein